MSKRAEGGQKVSELNWFHVEGKTGLGKSFVTVSRVFKCDTFHNPYIHLNSFVVFAFSLLPVPSGILSPL